MEGPKQSHYHSTFSNILHPPKTYGRLDVAQCMGLRPTNLLRYIR
jgi:hypothetical protein